MPSPASTSAPRRPAAYLLRGLGNAALADDLMQESYLRYFAHRVLRRRGDPAATSSALPPTCLRDHWRRRAQRASKTFGAISAARDRLSSIDSQATLDPR